MRHLTLILAALAAGPALAQTPPEVSPVTVMPRSSPPQVVGSFPAAGAAVAPGVLVLTVRFNQKMAPTGFDFAKGAAGETPECLATPRLLNDEKSFVLLCRTLPGKTYAVAFNGAPTGGFTNLGGNRAEPSALSFTTTSEPPVRSLEDAAKAAGLTDIDGPIAEAPGLKQAGVTGR